MGDHNEHDIKYRTSNKKRIKLAKYLQGFGHRIQKSGFEVWLSKSKFNKLVSELDKFCA